MKAYVEGVGLEAWNTTEVQVWGSEMRTKRGARIMVDRIDAGGLDALRKCTWC